MTGRDDKSRCLIERLMEPLPAEPHPTKEGWMCIPTIHGIAVADLCADAAEHIRELSAGSSIVAIPSTVLDELLEALALADQINRHEWYDRLKVYRGPKQAASSTIAEYFKSLRFDPAHHLGCGDVRLTIAQQDEIASLPVSATLPPEANELAGMARDARRYRWLRVQMATPEGVWIARGVIGNLSNWNGAQADTLIDAQMGATDDGAEK